MRLVKKALPVVTAAAIAMGNAALFPVISNAEAVNWDSYIKACPEWLPVDFSSAMDFYNTFGSSRADKDTICIVSHVPDNYKMKAGIKADYGSDGIIAESGYESHIFSFDFKLPEEPDKSDAKAYADYLDTMRRYEYTDITEKGSPGFHYEALVILNNAAKGLDVDISLEDKATGKSSENVSYTFVNEEGELRETDIYSWLPDTVPEFNEYIKKNGNISYRDGMLIYCNTINYSTGAALNVEQTGSGKLKLFIDGTMKRDEFILSAGGASSVMKVYKGETEGDAEISFTSGRSWAVDASDHKTLTASVHIDGNMDVTEKSAEVPEWIPQDFASAVNFSNEHGASFVKDGIICLVRCMDSDMLRYSKLSFEGTAAEKIKSYELTDKVYNDPDNGYIACNVIAYEIPDNTDITVNFLYGRFTENMRTVRSFSFIKDSTGYITQTDWYSWLPDSPEEFSAYYDKHGTFSVQDGYVMYCTNVPADGTYEFTIEQDGAGAFIDYHEESCEKQDITELSDEEPDYSRQRYIIKLFKPVKSGTVRLAVIKKGRWDDVNISEDAACFRITDDMHIIPAEESDIKTTVMGDCNGDGVIGISDMVTLKRWLHGKSSLPEYGSADVNGDGSVDIFDLVELRKQLINGIKEAPRPVMVFISENYAWSVYQSVTVIDQYGTAYSFKYGDESSSWSDAQGVILSMYDSGWYDRILKIMAESPGSAGFIPDSVMAAANSFAEKTESYSDTKMYSIGYMCDAGSNSLYLVNTGSDGKPVKAAIATFGDAVGWIDDEEVKNFIKLLDSYDIYGRGIIEVLEQDKGIF